MHILKYLTMDSVDSIESLVVEKKKISEILGQWSKTLRIPVVQREFEWDEEKIKLLIDSIVRSYPVGTIILLETYEQLPNAKIVGSDEELDSYGPFRYVIDGQQRLLSLMLLANSWKINRGNESIERGKISFNPSTSELLISDSIGINVSDLLHASMGNPKALVKLVTYHQDYETPLQTIGGKISNYELPIYTLKIQRGKQIDPVVISEIFTRINASGMKLGNLEIFISFFASAFPTLKELILERYKELNELYEDEYPSWESCIRTVFGNLGKSQSRITRKNSFKSTINEVKNEYEYRDAKLKEIIEKSFNSIKIGLSLISDELGISARKYMPSHTVMIPVYRWIFVNNISNLDEITKEDKNHILKWFLIASVNNFFTTWTERKLEKSLKLFTENTDFPVNELLTLMKSFPGIVDHIEIDAKTSNATKSTLMLLMAMLHKKGSSDWAGHPVLVPNISIQHIFPQIFSRNDELDSEYINSMANLTLINKSVNSQIQDLKPIVYLPRFNADLANHLIPPSSELWELDQFESFLDKRSELIKNELENLMKSFE